MREQLINDKYIMDKKTVQEYLVGFINDVLLENPVTSEHPLLQVFSAIEGRQRARVVECYIQCLFEENGVVSAEIYTLYRTILGVKLERIGDYYYTSIIE